MAAVDFETMWETLAPLGRSSTSGGYHRQPFAAAERECHAWFVEECARRDLRVESDGNGNTIGWWDVEGPTGIVPDETVGKAPDSGGKRQGLSVLTGSHLDSVLDGGAYDGPLGVLSALAAVDLLRERGITPTRPIGVGAFVEEEGSRFGHRLPRHPVGHGRDHGGRGARAARPRRRTRRGGHGGRRSHARPRPGGWLDGVGTFVELHVEQGRDLVERRGRGRCGQRDLAARPLPVRLPRSRQPRRHDADGGPARTRC